MLTIHVWPKWLKRFLLTHSLYKSPWVLKMVFPKIRRCVVWVVDHQKSKVLLSFFVTSARQLQSNPFIRAFRHS